MLAKIVIVLLIISLTSLPTNLAPIKTSCNPFFSPPSNAARVAGMELHGMNSLTNVSCNVTTFLSLVDKDLVSHKQANTCNTLCCFVIIILVMGCAIISFVLFRDHVTMSCLTSRCSQLLADKANVTSSDGSVNPGFDLLLEDDVIYVRDIAHELRLI